MHNVEKTDRTAKVQYKISHDGKKKEGIQHQARPFKHKTEKSRRKYLYQNSTKAKKQEIKQSMSVEKAELRITTLILSLSDW